MISKKGHGSKDKATPSTDWRQGFFAKQFTKGGVGLEIGPSHSPIAAKRDGYKVVIVDHADQAGLVEKYEALKIDTSRIEEVDYVWDGKKTLSELIKKPHSFDYIIASHVIEHTTDVILFLQDCEKLLKPSGKLCLAIPDKRYCFDYFRFPTVAADALQAFHAKNTRHTPAKVFDFYVNHAQRQGLGAWSSVDNGKLSLTTPPEDAVAQYKRAQKTSEYIDIHNWLFTPNSFRLLVADLQSLKLTKLSYHDELPTQGFEFFAILSPGSPPIKTPRIKLVTGMLEDIKSMLSIDGTSLTSDINQLQDDVRRLSTELNHIKQGKRWRYTQKPAAVLAKLRPKR